MRYAHRATFAAIIYFVKHKGRKTYLILGMLISASKQEDYQQWICITLRTPVSLLKQPILNLDSAVKPREIAASTDAPGYGGKVLITNKVTTNFPPYANHTIGYHSFHEFNRGI